VNRDDVLRMARQARDSAPLLTGNTREGDIAWLMNDTHMVRFAALVAAAERAECAKVADPKSSRGCDCERCDCGNSGNAERAAQWDAETAIAAAIRTRAVDQP
jgi:hypothetical protein